MEKQVIFNSLQNEVNAMVKSVENISDTHFFQQPYPEKWSIGQHIQHLIQSSKPLVSLFGKPELMNQWAKSDRTSRNYDEVKALYLNALQTPPPFLMVYRHVDTEGSKEEILGNIISITEKLIARASNMIQADLDTYQIPHPLLGLLTAGEFLHFTAFHTQHHYGAIDKMIEPFS